MVKQCTSLKKKKDYTVVGKYKTPRSYVLEGPEGERCRRNRKAMITVNFPPNSQPVVMDQRPIPRRSSRPNIGQPPVRYGH